MSDQIGKASALAREAMRAAQKYASQQASPGQGLTSGLGSTAGAEQPEFTGALDAIQQIDEKVKTAESMPTDLLTGKVNDFHEIAVQLKSAELSFKFAMEIRNKLVDAYREIMRMSV